MDDINKAVVEGAFSLDDFNASDEAEMTIILNGKPTDWKWRFAGPGHPVTVEYNNRTARDSLHESRQHEQTRLNGKKVKLPEETVDEVRERNVHWILARLLGWTPLTLTTGEQLSFSREAAKSLLLDPRKPFLQQAIDFLTADDSFTKRSARI